MAEYTKRVIHLKINGENGGNFTVLIDNGTCQVNEELSGEPDCVVTTTDSTYVDLELGEVNAQMALMTGKVKVSNIMAMMEFIQMFKRLH